MKIQPLFSPALAFFNRLKTRSKFFFLLLLIGLPLLLAGLLFLRELGFPIAFLPKETSLTLLAAIAFLLFLSLYLLAAFYFVVGREDLELQEAEADQKRATAELKEKQERFRRLIETSNEGIWVIDKQNELALANSRLAEMLECELEDLMCKPIFNFLEPEAHPLLEQNIQRMNKQGTKEQYDLAFVTKKGNKRWAIVSTSPIFDEKGGYNGALGMVTDITERKKVEGQLLQSQKMETVGTLAGGIAHDLNNQLTPIQGYLDLALNMIPPDHELRDILTEANRSAQHCTAIIKRLMNFSRPSTQAKVALSPQKLLEELKNLIGKLLPATMKVEIFCIEPVWPILGNETEIESVFMNLAANARDAMPQGGTLSIQAENVELADQKSGHVPGPYVVFTIQDTGMGIAPEILNRIYEPFFTTKQKGQGTGLGLAMVFKIIEDHKGWIEVASTVGKGTAFHLYFPANPGAAVMETKNISGITDALRGKGELILFADDEEPIRSLGKVFMGHLGYKALFAKDGEETVDLYEKNKDKIHVVLLDMTMPKLTGKQVIEKILSLNPKAKIIAASGYTAEALPQDLLKMGVSQFLPKPYTLVPFAEALRIALAA